MLTVSPTTAEADALRIARDAAACANAVWWLAAIAKLKSFLPGACTPFE